ncbi:MAG TPA: hypothetical protein ENJ18_09070 [Nannocystis exedens]|nr:hypothetical protein [Nannocystis exedens]
MNGRPEDNDEEPESPLVRLGGRLLSDYRPSWKLALDNVRETIQRRTELRARQVLFTLGLLVTTLVGLLLMVIVGPSVSPIFAVVVLIIAALLGGLLATFIPTRRAITSNEELALERLLYYHQLKLTLLEKERQQLEDLGHSERAIARRIDPKRDAINAEAARQLKAIEAGELPAPVLPPGESGEQPPKPE